MLKTSANESLPPKYIVKLETSHAALSSEGLRPESETTEGGSVTSTSKMPQTCPRWLKRLTFLLLLLGLGTLVLVAFHRPILTSLANAWIVDDSPIDQVDALIVPGGGFETRPFGAAELYLKGVSDRIITFQTEVSPRGKLGLARPHHQENIQILTKKGVPATAITVIGDHVASTQDEVNATADWCQKNDIQSIAVFTEYLASRRAAWAFRKQLSAQGVTVHLAALEHHPFTLKEWWLDEDGVITFQNEILKYFYYRLRY